MTKIGQKNVPAASIKRGDLVFRHHQEHGDVMMRVAWTGTGTTGSGQRVTVWRGDVYKLEGDGSGENAAFLGDIWGYLIGTDEWKMPIEGQVTTGAPASDADYEVP